MWVGVFVAKSGKMRFWVQNYLFCNEELAKTQAGKRLVAGAGAKVEGFCNLNAKLRFKIRSKSN